MSGMRRARSTSAGFRRPSRHRARGVLPHSDDDSWNEIIRLLAGQLQHNDAVLLIEALIGKSFARWRGSNFLSLCLGIFCLGKRRRRDYYRLQEVLSTIEQIIQDEKDATVRVSVVHTLGNSLIDRKVFEMLIELASDPSVSFATIEGLRAQAAGDPALQELLVDRASDPNASVRRVAVGALGARQVVDDPAVRALLMERAGDADSDISFAVIEALGELTTSDPALRALLIERAADADASVRRAAVVALEAPRDADDPEVRALLVERTGDADASVRAAAIEAVGEQAVGDPTVRALLIQRADDVDRQVREAAVQAWFRACGNRMAGVLLSQDRDLRFPWLDPRVPVDLQRVRLAAEVLHMTEDQIRAAYESVADELSACSGVESETATSGVGQLTYRCEP